MANQLTGVFDAALQISVQRLNGLLATMHQNRWEKEQNAASKLPTFPHADKIRLGPPPFGIDPHLLRLAVQAHHHQMEQTGKGSGIGLPSVSSMLESLPPEIAAVAGENLPNWENLTSLSADSTSIARGLAEVQISAPFVILANGDINKVTVHVFVRARYLADTPSHLLPERIHGEVRIGYELKREGNSLKVVPPEDDSKVSFISNTTLPHVVTAAITKEIGILVRERFRPSLVDFTSDFGFAGSFKAIGSGTSQVLAIPISLTGGVPVGSANSLNNAWLGNQDFALAVSKEFVGTQFEPALAPLRGFSVRITVNVDALIFGFSVAQFTLRILDARLEWSAGLVTLRVDAKLLASAIFGSIQESYDIAITQGMHFQLAPRTITLTAVDSDLKVTGAPDEFGIPDAAWKAARDARNRALPAVQQMVPKIFQNAESPEIGKGALLRIGIALRRFDPVLAVEYKNIEVNTNGLIVRGSISGGKRMAPIADIRSADDGDSYTALHSWIPGGRIEKLVWGMYEKVPFQKALAGTGLLWTLPWEGMPKFSGEETEHFMFPHAWTLPRSTTVCLTIYGSRRNLRGVVEDGDEVWGADNTHGLCAPVVLPPIFILPNWKKFEIPNIWPDFTGELILEDLVFAHIDAAAHDWPAGELTTNHLVHFLDWNAEQPMQAIHEALALMKKKRFALTLVVVVPQGSLKVHRTEMEAKLGLDGPHEKVGQKEGQSPVHIQIAEDLNQGWSEMFHASSTPATFFVNARQEPVWGVDGAVDPGELAAVLDKEIVPAPAAKGRLPEPAIRPGNLLPSISFIDDQGSFIRLEDFSEKELMLCFWKSTSQPSLRELQRLQEIQKTDGELIIVGLCGDEDAEVISRIRDQYQLSFILGQDPDRHIARSLKVRCWPTTLRVGREGILHSTQFGYPMKQGLGKE
ncbi:TlpA disulfide reductase family protein [Roseimicrobium sp. ORNL1]|uniref:TlpA family protein disulfide reductase n=1 Tax=Roseimicrobium sp. ORNL1 TaxID=2711231 RepID=UPI0013E1C437|nr:TlpA disulfide reductase family protein [Roseimicrobium sp. ORNL1]QIF04438.1 redoxin domain-containing protein [Roseimicrobium sp. ORNL1]